MNDCKAGEGQVGHLLSLSLSSADASVALQVDQQRQQLPQSLRLLQLMQSVLSE